MSEVQPAEFIYYKYTQTHTHTHFPLCAPWHMCDCDTSVPKKKKRVNTIRAKGEERRRGVSVKGILALP